MRTRTTSPRRKPGRPALSWLSWPDLVRLPHGTAVVIDAPGTHEERFVGRIARPTSERGLSLILRDRSRAALEERQVRRGRVVDSPFMTDDFVLKRGVDKGEWRGVVDMTDGDGRMVLVLNNLGGREWLREDLLDHADDRLGSVDLPPMKPGPIHGDPAVEELNQAAYEERLQEDEPWAG